MREQSVVILKGFEKPEEVGTYHRLLCMTGEDKGMSYYLNDERLILGRGDSAHIQIMDAKSSREHAELKKLGEEYILTDLSSQNGIVVNDLKISQHTLSDGDRIIIGKTVYKYNLLLVDEKDIVLPTLRGEVEKLKSEKVESEESKLKNKNSLKDGNKKNKLPLILGALVVGYFLISGEDGGQKKKAVESINDRVESRLSKDFSADLKRDGKDEDRVVEAKLGVLIHRGLREYREKNFFRAIKQFELALVLSPTNGRARFYLSKTKKSLDDEVETLFLKANQDLGALKYRAASSAYCSVLRLLQGYPNDERYIDAQNGVKQVEKSLGLDEGDIKCIISNKKT